MKSIKKVLSACLVALAGCQAHETLTGTTFSLKEDKVILAVDDEFAYEQYIDEDYQNYQYDVTEVDTSQTGRTEVTYTTEDGGKTYQQVLTVFVVEYLENEMIDPRTVEAEIVVNPEDITTMVNKFNAIPKDWEPNDLEPVIDNQGQKLRKEANEAYTKFYKSAKSQGIDIYTISSYRTQEMQDVYWSNSLEVFGVDHASMYSAYPGRSEHQLGLAVDVSYTVQGDRLSDSVASSPIGKYMEEEAYKYGFVLRYPKDKVNITQYGYEPWHIRYVGIELAKELYEKNLTLEEYYEAGENIYE